MLAVVSGCSMTAKGTVRPDSAAGKAGTAAAAEAAAEEAVTEEVYEGDIGSIPCETEVYEAYEMPAMATALFAYGPEGEMWAEDHEFNTEEYSYTKENPFRSVRTAPFSTFAADVDTASYANMRRQILQNGSVVPDSVRIEEMINYFHYDYPEPEGEEPFSVTVEITDCPWNEDTQLMMIGLQAKKPDTENMPQSNLVFLIDVSGSMDEKNKLPLVQRSFMTLVENLDKDDRVSVITYSSGEEIVLDGVPMRSYYYTSSLL